MTETLSTIEEKIRRGRHDEAKRALDAVRPSEDDENDIQFLRGYWQERSYDRQGALTTYDKILGKCPDHPKTAFRAAWLYDQGGDEETAIELYERCMEESTCSINVVFNLAVLYEDRGMLADAETLLNSILDEFPNHVRARQLLKSVQSSANMVFDEQSQREREKRNAVLDTPISDFELSVRSRNCLRQMNIRTLGDLLKTTEAELLSYKNFGETSLNEIKTLLTQRNLRLGQSLQPLEPMPTLTPPPLSADVTVHANRSVAELELSVRSRKALMRLGVTTLGELAQRSEPELLTIKNFGQTSLNEIKRQLAVYGMSLRQQ